MSQLARLCLQTLKDNQHTPKFVALTHLVDMLGLEVFFFTLFEILVCCKLQTYTNALFFGRFENSSDTYTCFEYILG